MNPRPRSHLSCTQVPSANSSAIATSPGSLSTKTDLDEESEALCESIENAKQAEG